MCSWSSSAVCSGKSPSHASATSAISAGRATSSDARGILLDSTFKPTPLGPVTIISAANSPPPSTASGPGQLKWWPPHAYTQGKVADGRRSGSGDAAKTEEAAKALEEAFAHSQGATVLRFWDAVIMIIMCKHRGVWLEDCRGVNITRNDLLRGAELSAY